MIRLHNVSVYFKDKPGLIDINISIKKGEFVYLIGPTGAGKTTLLRTIYHDLKPDDGFVQFGKFNLNKIKARQIPFMRRQIGIIFQDFKLLNDRNVYDNVIFTLRATGSSSKEAKKRAVKALTNVGLLSKRNNTLDGLSGGELQRLCIARAIANEPVIIIADEPTGNLDPNTAHGIFELLYKLNLRGSTVLTATHNYKIVHDFPGRIIYLEEGRQVNGISD